MRNSVEQTMARIRRFRDDVDWQIFDQRPSPEDLGSVDLWVDPAAEENDFDGFVAEALVVGLPVVATRTPINDLRLEQGRTGFLVPPRDPNEMTHAILSALFKTEVAESRESQRQADGLEVPRATSASRSRLQHRTRNPASNDSMNLLQHLPNPQRRAIDLVREVAEEKECHPFLVGGPVRDILLGPARRSTSTSPSKTAPPPWRAPWPSASKDASGRSRSS